MCDFMDAQIYRFSELPILQGCECYTCKNFSQSYLYHLNEVKEMNFGILLAIHNLHMIDQLFAQI